MSNEVKIDHMKVNINAEIETIYRVVKRFAQPGDKGKSIAIARGLEELARGVQLSAEDYKVIQAKVKENYERRLEVRAKKSNRIRG